MTSTITEPLSFYPDTFILAGKPKSRKTQQTRNKSNPFPPPNLCALLVQSKSFNAS